jgi:hypothetical protein
MVLCGASLGGAAAIDFATVGTIDQRSPRHLHNGVVDTLVS